MSNEILLIPAFFLTRIVLPIIVTLLLGSCLERRLHREARSS
jgi:hypothetical protein